MGPWGMLVKRRPNVTYLRSTTIIYRVCSLTPQKNESIDGRDRVLTRRAGGAGRTGGSFFDFSAPAGPSAEGAGGGCEAGGEREREAGQMEGSPLGLPGSGLPIPLGHPGCGGGTTPPTELPSSGSPGGRQPGPGHSGRWQVAGVQLWCGCTLHGYRALMP